MRPSGVLETALYVKDLGVAERFYADVLGLEPIAKTENRLTVFRCGSGVVLLFNAEATEHPPAADARLPVPPHGARGPGHMAFSATGEEIERWKRHLQAQGVAIEADFEWPQGGRSIYLRDPSGNSLEFTEPRIWGL